MILSAAKYRNMCRELILADPDFKRMHESAKAGLALTNELIHTWNKKVRFKALQMRELSSLSYMY